MTARPRRDETIELIVLFVLLFILAVLWTNIVADGVSRNLFEDLKEGVDYFQKILLDSGSK